MVRQAGGKLFSGLRAPALAVAAWTLAGCSTATVDDTVSLAAAPGRTGSPTDTGTYPNLNIAPKVAAQQFTPEESAAKMAALDAKREQQAPGSGAELAEARKKRLKLLADEHGADTLQIIESE